MNDVQTGILDIIHCSFLHVAGRIRNRIYNNLNNPIFPTPYKRDCNDTLIFLPVRRMLCYVHPNWDISSALSILRSVLRRICRGYNRRNTDKDPLAHAEIKAIKKASKKMGDWRLEQCTMYVTLEPCQMCAGAIIQSRLTRVIVGCMNPKAGCAGSVLNLLDIKQFNHQAELTTGVLEEECSALMTGFFRELREKNRRKR